MVSLSAPRGATLINFFDSRSKSFSRDYLIFLDRRKNNFPYFKYLEKENEIRS